MNEMEATQARDRWLVSIGRYAAMVADVVDAFETVGFSHGEAVDFAHSYMEMFVVHAHD